MARIIRLSLLAAVLLGGAVRLIAQTADPRHPPLSGSDIDDIATLLRLEDTRAFDGEVLGRLAHSKHPEVQRRAIVSLGRIVNDDSRALVAQLRTEFDVLSGNGPSLAFASGQLKDPQAVAWLGVALDRALEPIMSIAAARALGEIRTPDARAVLGKYLNRFSRAGIGEPGVGEALLSLGRFTDKGADLAPIVRFIKSPDPELRWRVAWALFRPRDPAALPYLQDLLADPSPEVRFWAVRGLAPAVVDQAGGDRAKVSASIRGLVRDEDRRVRTEALRALLQFDDDGAFEELLAALKSPDTWLSTSAAENALRFKERAEALRPALVAAAAPAKPLWLRQVALTPLITLAPEAAIDVATSMARESVGVARASAVQALGQLGVVGRARYEELTSDPALKAVLPALGGRGGGGGGGQRPPPQVHTEADYRRIVEAWVVPDYNGQPKPRAIWETNRGTIDLELFAGDAPLGMEYFVKALESGDIVGTEFSRVVPNFVDQQQTIPNAPLLRDEVNLRGLNRGTLAWASNGLDTGRAGYTLGITPQPHNEGNFTALGQVISGMDVVDHMEWGDKITAARMSSPRR